MSPEVSVKNIQVSYLFKSGHSRDGNFSMNNDSLMLC